MTDTALAAAVTLAMVAFWLALHEPGRAGTARGYVFFVALGLGLHAKGPVILNLVGAPIADGWCSRDG